MTSPFAWPAAALLCFVLAGCASPQTEKMRDVQVHVGHDPGGAMYVRPNQLTVDQGDEVRLIVTNDDDPMTDYNDKTPGRDNFHSLVLMYDADGDGEVDELRHEVAAGTTATTDFQGRDSFIAGQPGTFQMACDIMTMPSHESRGMQASFVVR